ncbi:MAG: winged helix-turn-helix domain-containing protein [Terriglobales bacterium]
MEDSSQLAFGPFILDTQKRILACGDQPVALTRKSFAILELLASNAGRVVTKEEIKRAVWPDVVVEEATLSQNIFLIRKLLSEKAPGTTFIETIAGTGYRFQTPEKGSPARGNSASITTPTIRVREGWRRWAPWAIAGALGLALIIAGVARMSWRNNPPRSVAVLPFSNLTGNPGYDYAAQGLADALLTDLGGIPGLRVVSARSAVHYAKSDSATDLVSKLGVDAFIEGSVLQDADQLVVDVRLVHAGSDRTLWTGRYLLGPRELLRAERTMGEALRRQLTPTDVAGARPSNRPATSNVEAYDAYLLGRFFWEKRTEPDYRKAIQYFERAISLDPGFAQAHAGLADTYALLASMPNSEISRGEGMERARAAALRALQLDGDLAQAHTSLAFVLMHYDWDGPRAEAEFRRALQLDPNYATAHHWYAYLLMARGRPADSLNEIRRAMQCDPVSPIVQTDMGELLFENREFAAAEREIRRALELDPEFSLAHFWLGRALDAQGNHSAASAEFQRAYDLSGSLWALSGLADADAEIGERKKAVEMVAKLGRLCTAKSGCGSTLAPLYAKLGRPKEALKVLHAGLAERDGSLIFINQDVRFDVFRGQQEFDRLAQQVTDNLTGTASTRSDLAAPSLTVPGAGPPLPPK